MWWTFNLQYMVEAVSADRIDSFCKMYNGVCCFCIFLGCNAERRWYLLWIYLHGNHIVAQGISDQGFGLWLIHKWFCHRWLGPFFHGAVSIVKIIFIEVNTVNLILTDSWLAWWKWDNNLDIGNQFIKCQCFAIYMSSFLIVIIM